MRAWVCKTLDYTRTGSLFVYLTSTLYPNRTLYPDNFPQFWNVHGYLAPGSWAWPAVARGPVVLVLPNDKSYKTKINTLFSWISSLLPNLYPLPSPLSCHCPCPSNDLVNATVRVSLMIMKDKTGQCLLMSCLLIYLCQLSMGNDHWYVYWVYCIEDGLVTPHWRLTQGERGLCKGPASSDPHILVTPLLNSFTFSTARCQEKAIVLHCMELIFGSVLI